jgi:glycosyltransferase involved in cell wall biosynthesis
MKSVLHIVGDSEYGGGSKIIEALVVAGLSNGWNVSVLTTDPVFMARVAEIGAVTVDLDCIWRPIKPFKDLFGLLLLRKYLKQHKYDIVHTHTTKAGLVGRVAARLAGINKIIHTVHGFAFSEVSPKKKVIFYSLIEKVAGYFCDKIVTVSEYHKQWALRLNIAPADKILAIPNGIQGVNTSLAGVKEQKGIKILFVGRLVLEKGILDLVSAVSKLNESGLGDVSLYLLGSGEDEASIIDHAKSLGTLDKINFLGFRSDVSTYFELSNIFCLPSYREGLSISLLEAMSTGISIVASDVGGNREALASGGCGLLYPSGNVDELYNNLVTLIVTPNLRTKLGLEAKERFNNIYTEKSMTDSYMKIYRELYVDS